MRPHISIDVKNIEKSVEFYEKVFGLKPQKQSDTYAKFDLQKPALNFSIQSHEGSSASRVNHLGIEVDSPSDLLLWQESLQAQGLVKRVETQTASLFRPPGQNLV